MRLRMLAALLLLAPTAAAQQGVAFEIDLADPAGDVRGSDGRNLSYAGVDILRLVSSVEDGWVKQRVELGGRPVAPDDSVLVRSWFRHSENGSWAAVDMEVLGSEPDPAQRFRPYLRFGDFRNVTYLEARWGVDGEAWVFEFNTSKLPEATCFDPGVFTERTPARRLRQPQGFDQLYLEERRCRQSPEPEAEFPPPILFHPPSIVEPPEPPGSRSPTPLAPWLALAALALAARRRAQ